VWVGMFKLMRGIESHEHQRQGEKNYFVIEMYVIRI